MLTKNKRIFSTTGDLYLICRQRVMSTEEGIAAVTFLIMSEEPEKNTQKIWFLFDRDVGRR